MDLWKTIGALQRSKGHRVDHMVCSPSCCFLAPLVGTW